MNFTPLLRVSAPITVFLLLCAASRAQAQDSLSSAPPSSIPLSFVPTSDVPDSLWSVDSIIVTGNFHTKSFVIVREMTLRPGLPITRRRLEYDQNRIYSLRLFNEVRMAVVPSAQGFAHVVVEVSERWYIFPYPIFGIRDRDWSRIFFGAGIVHTNFRGRNEKLNASLVLGADPSLGLSYRNPFLDANGTTFAEGRIAFSRVRNRSVLAEAGRDNFDERHYGLSGRFGWRFGIDHTMWIEAGYEVVDISDHLPIQTLSPDGIDRYPIGRIGYSYDTRDLGEYAASGVLLTATISKFGWPSADVDIVRYAADARGYVPLLFNTVLGARVFGDLAAAGRTASYNRVYFGYGERIRGHFKQVFEGESILGASAELHYPLLSPRFFRVQFLPPEFSVWRFGITAAIFADAGTVWFRGSPVALNNVVKGYGCGIDFLLPYSAVIRAEYALDEVRRGEFILDAGASF